MAALFKMNPKTPFMKALVGKQGNLPQHLQDAIKAAPAKKTTDPKEKGRTLGDMKSGQYGTIRPMTDAEALKYGQSKGIPTATVRRQEKKYMSEVKGRQSRLTDAQKSRARMESRQGGNQMGKIISAGPNESDRLRKVKELQSQNKSKGKSPAKSYGKSPAKMKGVKGLKK